MSSRLFAPFAALVIASCAPATAPPRGSAIVWMGTSEARAASCVSPTQDAGPADAFDPRPPGFAIVVLDPELTIAPGESVPLRVRIERAGSFDAPVLVELWGLPATLTTQSREARAEDVITELTIEADP